MGFTELLFSDGNGCLAVIARAPGKVVRGGCKFFLCFIVFLQVLLAGEFVWAEESKTVVWYPELVEPYSGVFDEILQGIRKGSNGRVDEVSLGAASDVNALLPKLGGGGSGPVILLGQRAIDLAGQFDSSYRFVAGASYHLSPQENFVFISYRPSPKQVYAHLKSLFPNITTLYVIFGREGSQWLKSEALMDAQAEGVQLIYFEKDNLRDSAKMIRGIMQDIEAETEAVWIIPDPSVIDDKVIVPYLLREAWKKNVVLIANSLAHVDRGMLFALYPDNVRLGQAMAEVSQQLASGHYKGPKIRGLKALKYAINVRTAKHLGLELDQTRLKRYSLVFPQR